MKQIFGHTGQHEPGEQCVRFVQAFQGEDGYEIHVRDGAGQITTVALPKDQAAALAAALTQ